MRSLFLPVFSIYAVIFIPLAFSQELPQIADGRGLESPLINILSNIKRSKSLGISSEQIDKITAGEKALSATGRQAVIAIMRDNSRTREEKRLDVASAESAQSTKTRELLDEVLTPEQFERLRLLYVKEVIAFGGLEGLIASDDVVKYLGLSSQRLESLRVSAAKLDLEFELEVSRIREKQIRSLIEGSLDSGQKQKLGKILGVDLRNP